MAAFDDFMRNVRGSARIQTRRQPTPQLAEIDVPASISNGIEDGCPWKSIIRISPDSALG